MSYKIGDIVKTTGKITADAWYYSPLTDSRGRLPVGTRLVIRDIKSWGYSVSFEQRNYQIKQFCWIYKATLTRFAELADVYPMQDIYSM